MDQLKDLPIHREFLISERNLEQFSDFVDFLLTYTRDHPENIPYNFGQLAQELAVTEEFVRDHFAVISKCFNLFKLLQSTMTTPSNTHLSKDSIASQSLIITHSDLKSVGDFYCLATRTPIKPQFLKKKFQQVIQTFSPFFIQNDQGWMVSDLGKFVAEQYLACKKINTIPRVIKHPTCTLTVMENNTKAEEYNE
jgi:hypothetical protein